MRGRRAPGGAGFAVMVGEIRGAKGQAAAVAKRRKRDIAQMKAPALVQRQCLAQSRSSRGIRRLAGRFRTAKYKADKARHQQEKGTSPGMIDPHGQYLKKRKSD